MRKLFDLATDGVTVYSDTNDQGETILVLEDEQEREIYANTEENWEYIVKVAEDLIKEWKSGV